MWWFVELVGIFLLILGSEGRPRRYNLIAHKAITASARLNSTVIPSKYELNLTVTDDNLKYGNFSGKVAITINITQNLEVFFLHVKDLEILDPVTLSGNEFDGNVTTEGPDTNDLLAIKSDKTIQESDNYVLTINYKGILSTTDMEGFYRSTYNDDQGFKKYLATTQFEEMGARRAFPCFDEPALKATFIISITFSNEYFALSNTKEKNTTTSYGLSTTTFLESPRMSTYLLAFIVSQFACKKLQSNVTEIEICARNGTQDTMTLALSTTPQALTIMEAYTNVTYKDMGLGKLTEVAIPDFVLGGMENWGLVTYREPALLYDEAESSNFYKQKVVGLITHELSHQWFGDAITLDWWSNIFLNEGFATYFQYHVADQIYPFWEMTKQFVIDQLQTALVSDSENSSLPLHYDTDDASVIVGRFDDISYNKGGSILRMVQHFLGLDKFKLGLASYLSTGSIATVDNLWTSLQEHTPTVDPQKLPDTVANVMANWTNKAGYPVLSVSLSEDETNVTISQQRFLMSETDNDGTKWYVPITYTTSKNADNFVNTTTQAWLTPSINLTIALEDADWIILNNQQVGYYRVNYDDKLFKKISDVLNSTNFRTIDEISRSQLVDDQINFAKAGFKSYSDLLDFLSFLKREDSYYTWSSAFAGFSFLLQRTRDVDVRRNLTNYILQNMKALSRSVPVENEENENQIYTLKQVLTLTWACNLGDIDCIHDARARFDIYTKNETAKPSPNLRSIVYCNGLRTSENATESFDFLWNKYLITTLSHEQLTLLNALGCVNDSSIRKLYLNQSLTSDIRIQDATYVFSSVYSNNAEGVDDVFDFIKENYQNFEPQFGQQSPLNSLIYAIADLFTTQDQIDKLNQFSETDGLDESIKTVVKDAVTLATNNLKIIKNVEDDLKKYFGWQSNSASIISYQFFHLALVVTVYFKFNYF